jgi:hypothetical protein
MLAPIQRLLNDVRTIRGWLKEGRSFEYSVRSLRFTWLSETRVLIAYWNDRHRGSVGFRRRTRSKR